MNSRDAFFERTRSDLRQLQDTGLYKREYVLLSAQGATITVRDGDRVRELINMCSNNYLGLASDPEVVAAARDAAERWGSGTASVRFICGTLAIHEQLEAEIAAYVGQPAAILFAAAFDANAGVFEALLGPEDAIISDSLNHASIIDGVRLCRARRYRFANGDMDQLECCLKQARADGVRSVLVATDGVFSMDGVIADLRTIAALAHRHGALVLVDDSHATGVIGPCGRGTPALHGIEVDIVTGTFGKALGGAMGGFIAAAPSVIDLLRQRARPYLFSNALAPAACGSALAAIAIASSEWGNELRKRLSAYGASFRKAATARGLPVLGGGHPITPVQFGETHATRRVAEALFERGVYAAPFFYPVVPKNEARIRFQWSSEHREADVDHLLAFLDELKMKA